MVRVIKKGNLHEGEEGEITKVDTVDTTHPIEVTFKDGSKSHYSHDELSG